MIFELDRHGAIDFINECSTGQLCNDEFAKAITYYIGTKGMVLKQETGVYTDVGALRSINTTAQMFYMSCGYYNEHSENEYLIPGELQSAITKAHWIIYYVNEHPEILTPFVPDEKPERDNGYINFQDKDPDNACYCYDCDAYLLRDELINGRCPYCGGRNIEAIDDFS